MWGSVVTSLLFWGFANEVTTVDEAKKYCKYAVLPCLCLLYSPRSYFSYCGLPFVDPLFGMGANVALIFSGQYVKWVSNMRSTLAPGVDAWAVSLRFLMAAVVGSGGVLLAAYKYMQDNIVAKNKEMSDTKKLPRKKKARMTMKESAKFLMGSPYIRDLATLVISYGLCINIVEVSWKSKLKVGFVPLCHIAVPCELLFHPLFLPCSFSKPSRTRTSTRLSWATFRPLQGLSL